MQIGAPGDKDREIERNDPGEQTQGQTEGEASPPAGTGDWIAYPALHDDRPVNITEAFPWDEAPRYLIRDRDTSYGAAVTRRLQAMGIRDRPITPRSPWQNGHVERLIGSIRRECLHHVVLLGERHLRHLLANYATLQWGEHAPCA